MKRLLGAFAVAAALAGGTVAITPASVVAQGRPGPCFHACREAFTSCMREARTPAAAAACRTAARTCLAACSAD
jgi:hypothetical protein